MRKLVVLVVVVLLLVVPLLLSRGGSSGGTGDGAVVDSAGMSRPALPPGMARVATNADRPPPAIPLSPATRVDTVRATASWPHDPRAFTQGLLVHDGRLFESTGLEGRSTLREVRRETGAPIRVHSLPRSQFGEGIAVANGRLYQLTWRSGLGYVYSLDTLALVDSVRYTGEGWGLASGDGALYRSDGSSTIAVVDPATFATRRTFEVTEAGRPVHALNELEWVEGALWANVYQTPWIARIDPATGAVTRWLYTGALLSASERDAVRAAGGTANGIAWDSASRRLLLTGKYWPRLFAVPLPR